jgi:hypothetical protein
MAIGITSTLASSVLAPFSAHNPMISLLLFGVLLGIGMLWVYKLTSNQEAVAKVKGRLFAHLYEMRLFTDEPALIWKAQFGLLTANIRYLGLMLLPALVMLVPMALILAQLECFYGFAPLQPGAEAIVTVQMKDPGSTVVPVLRAPEGITIETPAVRVEDSHEISWRIRAERPVSGELQVVLPSQTVTKSIQAGSGPQYLSERRVSSALSLLEHPAERPLPSGPVESIELRYPKATVHALGLDLHWLIWLVVISMISALVFKRRFGVSF